MRTSLLVAVLFLLQAPAASLNQILASVSRNVQDFQQLLPDFVCNEKITSTAYESGKLKETRTVESIFRAIKRPAPASPGFQLVFTETRDITAIDGNPARKGARPPKLPLAMFGGFGALLSMTFSPENLQYHQYELDEILGGAGIVVHFSTKKGQRELRSFLDGEGLVNRDLGMAWIDSNSMQVVRLQRDFFSLPRTLRQLRNTVDYSPVLIGDRQFWLPNSMRTDATDRDPKKTKTFLAEYTNCKRFTAEIKIVP
jgi:hypothetical protein